ncbi:hypothetical protein C7448_102516 [Tenacibaculum gallaicum]|uniref:Uncharacterized protein n=1 Tax=Tenacibaculum gallaicum TaxID=561505 RepID=A0A3E0I8A8_9FLAO|nr:hypothetical protein [Tenacibaculum gallaicum]REH54983.1 hypothetical protein C7448_102516 [Tenacibaculum gallaicum]
MDRNYIDGTLITFIKSFIIIPLGTIYFAITGYIGVQNPRLDYFILAFFYGLFSSLLIKYIIDSNKRRFIYDIKYKKIKPILSFKYTKSEWVLFIQKNLTKRKKKHAIITLCLFIASISLIYFGYTLKNDGEFALAIGYNILMASLFWGIFSYRFLISPLKYALECSVREVQCFKYGIVLINEYYIIKTFSYMKNVSLSKKHNKHSICFTDETRGTSLEGYDANRIMKFTLPIPKEEKENSKKIYTTTFRSLLTSK